MNLIQKLPEYKDVDSYGHTGKIMLITAKDLTLLPWRKKVDQVEAAINLGERAQQAVTSGHIPPENAVEFLDRIGDIIASNPLLP